MKTVLLFLAMMGGTGFLFRDHLQSLVHPGHQAVAPQASPARVAADPSQRTNFEASAGRREGPVSTAQAPVFYNVYRQEVVERPAHHREIIVREREARPVRATPPPILRNH